MVGDRRVTQEPKRKVAGSGRREGKKHHNDFVIFHNRNGAKRWEPLWKGGRERSKKYATLQVKTILVTMVTKILELASKLEPKSLPGD